MTVCCLSTRQQHEIAVLYKTGYLTQVTLADYYNVSPSTINKVLDYYGLTRKRPRLSVDQAKMLNFLEVRGMSFEKLQALLED